MKLFQIEEPDGRSADPTAPGAAIGIDAAGTEIEVAFSVGGNAVILVDHEDLERVLPVPGATAAIARWQAAFEAARTRAERALVRPVTHAVIVLARTADGDTADRLRQAAEAAGFGVLRFAAKPELPAGKAPVLAAAALAEDLAPRPD